MNERIRELIKQHGVDIIIDGMGYGEGNIEGFAELIVRECAELCVKHETVIGPFNTKEFRKGGHFNNIIKQHFGVEE